MTFYINLAIYEIPEINCEVFEKYLQEFSKHRSKEYKIVVIDNAAFHSTKNINIPDNIYLLRIPPYTPELNPCEQVWKYIKDRYANQGLKINCIIHMLSRKQINNSS